MPHPTRARLFAAACLAAILWLTLTPALREGAHPVPSPWCFRCSDGDSVDVLLNVILFLPLGTALAWLGMARFPALSLATALTVAIEVTQFFFIPGRDGSIRDVLCNSAGAAIGFSLASQWRGVFLPSIGRARQAFFCALLFWLSLALLSSWALGAMAPPGEWWVQLDPHGLGSVDFPGHLITAELDSVPLVNGKVEDPAEFKRAVAAHRVDNLIRLASGGPAAGTAPIFGLVTAEPVEVLRLSQRGDDGLYKIDTRGYGAGLVVPVFALPHTFRRGAPDTVEWHARYDGKRIRLDAAHSTGEHQYSDVAITPNQGWQLFWPFEPRRPDPAAVITLLWAAALPCIAAYYSSFQAMSMPAAASMMAATFLIADILVPLLAGIAAATPFEWLAALSGAAAGWSTGTILRERL